MPADAARLPKYRHYKPKDLAVVRIDGRDHYLGKYGSDASREKYRRVVAEWLAARAALAADAARPAGTDDLTVDELILAFWTRHAERLLPPSDGRPTGELDNYPRLACGPSGGSTARTPAGDFGPLALKAVRQAMIDAGPGPDDDQPAGRPDRPRVQVGASRRRWSRRRSTRR